MKKYVTLILSAALLLGTFSSCKKEGHGRDTIKNVTLNVTIAAGATYQLDLSPYADEDDLANITKQATNYQTSVINQTAPGKFVYVFVEDGTPKTAANNTQQVVLKVYEPAGRCRRQEETNITINFTIQ